MVLGSSRFPSTRCWIQRVQDPGSGPRSGFKIEHPKSDGTGDPFAVISAEILPAFDVAGGGGRIAFGQSLSETGDSLHSVGISQHWDLNVAFNAVEPIDAFTGIASDVQDLVSIAVGKTADFERVVLRHPDVPLRSLSGVPIGDFRDEIHYRARWSNRTADGGPVKAHERYFSFDDFGGADGVGRWMMVAQEYRTELGRVMATRYSDAMYLEDRVMNVCAALDSFDAVRRGAPALQSTSSIASRSLSHSPANLCASCFPSTLTTGRRRSRKSGTIWHTISRGSDGTPSRSTISCPNSCTGSSCSASCGLRTRPTTCTPLSPDTRRSAG